MHSMSTEALHDELIGRVDGMGREQMMSVIEFIDSMSIRLDETSPDFKKKFRTPGGLQGSIWMSDDLDAPLEFAMTDGEMCEAADKAMADPRRYTSEEVFKYVIDEIDAEADRAGIDVRDNIH